MSLPEKHTYTLAEENALLRSALRAVDMFRHPRSCICAGCSDVRVLLAREPAAVLLPCPVCGAESIDKQDRLAKVRISGKAPAQALPNELKRDDAPSHWTDDAQAGYVWGWNACREATRLLAEAPAPAAPGEVEWEMRIAGPDDVLVFSSQLEALHRANEVNKQYIADRLKHPDNEVLCVATVHLVFAAKVPRG